MIQDHASLRDSFQAFARCHLNLALLFNWNLISQLGNAVYLYLPVQSAKAVQELARPKTSIVFWSSLTLLPDQRAEMV